MCQLSTKPPALLLRFLPYHLLFPPTPPSINCFSHRQPLASSSSSSTVPFAVLFAVFFAANLHSYFLVSPFILPAIYSTFRSPLFITTRRHTASFFPVLTKPVPPAASCLPTVQIISPSCLMHSTRQTYLKKLFPNHTNTINAPIIVLVSKHRKEWIQSAQSEGLL